MACCLSLTAAKTRSGVNGIVLRDQEHDVRSLGRMDCQGEEKRGKYSEKGDEVHEDVSGGVKKEARANVEFISSQWHKDFRILANKGVRSR